MNTCARFHKDSPSGKKLNSISRARLNFQRRPILCTTLYRNLMQASNFGGAFDQLFLWIFLRNLHRSCLSTSSIRWCKTSQKWPKTQIKGSCLNITKGSTQVEFLILGCGRLPKLSPSNKSLCLKSAGQQVRKNDETTQILQTVHQHRC